VGSLKIYIQKMVSGFLLKYPAIHNPGTIMWIFHVMWIREKPANMMAYPAVRKLLENELANRLRRDGCLNVPIGEYDFRTNQ
jgi:hypothetical protein